MLYQLLFLLASVLKAIISGIPTTNSNLSIKWGSVQGTSGQHYTWDTEACRFPTLLYQETTFYGGGFEIEPPNTKLKISALYGRFAKAANDISQASYLGSVLYNRWGYGSKITYGSNTNNVGVTLFKAWDDENSLVLSDFDPENTPKENLILGINAKQTIKKNLILNLEYAQSAFSDDVNSAEVTLQSYSYYNNIGLFTPRLSSKFNNAINGNLTYQKEKYNVGVSYRRIDPEYQSLGIPFMNNDLEDISLNLAWRMLKNKMNIATSGGLQRNNLNEDNATQTKRLVGSVNANYVMSEHWNMNASYSNFNTSTVMVRIKDLDSLNYYQVTKSSMLGIN